MTKKITPEQHEFRKKLSVFLEDVGINDVDGVKNLFNELVGTVLENGGLFQILCKLQIV